MEGMHGRLPTIETAIVRLDSAQERDNKAVNARVDRLEAEGEQEKGRRAMKEFLVNVATSSVSAAAIGAIAKILGFIH